MKLTNTTTGPRGVYVDGNLAFVEPGASIEGVGKDEAESVKEWFEAEPEPKPAAKPKASGKDV